jgi:MFS transporter, PPP family, 3-phenylpropionic acid transporter
VPYWRLSGFYLFYFASLGALVPYWSLYLKSLGFSSLEIGELMALLMVTKVIAPNVWGWLADHTGRRMRVVRIGSFLSMVLFLGVFWTDTYWRLALVMFGFSFFWNAVLPQFESVTLVHLAERSNRYSMIRLWGSVGFIFSVAALGPLLEYFGPQLLPPVLLGIYISIFLSSLLVPERVEQPHHDSAPLGDLLRKPAVIALIFACFLLQASHGPYYTFYTIYLEEHGYSRTLIGQLWALGVIAEVMLFLVMHRLEPRIGLRRLFLVALFLTGSRWLMIGFFPDSMLLLLLAQLLHAASFGIFHAVAVALFHCYFRGRHHGKGQAIYGSLGFGAGGAFGSYYAGAMWDSLGPVAAYSFAALLAFLSFAIAARWIGRDVK